MKEINRKKALIVFFTAIIYNLLVYLLFLFESNIDGGNILNLKDAYWYSIVTLTTVGYGDFYPLTFWGRSIGFVFVIGSLGILGVIVTELSLTISSHAQKKKEGYFGTKMKNHSIIIGWDEFSQQVAEQIIKAKRHLAIITNEKDHVERINKLFPKGDCFVYITDLKDYASFDKVNIENSERVYINFPDDADTLVYTINLKKNFPGVTCVVVLENMELKSTFNFMGVNFVISRNEIASKLVASYIFEPNVALLTEDLLSTSGDGDELDIWECPIEENSRYVGEDYLEMFIAMKKKHNAVLLGVSRNNELYKNPSDFSIEDKDIIIFIGNHDIVAQELRG